MNIIPLLVLFGVGIVMGTQAPLLVQGIMFIFYIIYMNSNKVKRMEIGALIPFIFGIIFFIGVLIGDISYMFQTDALIQMDFGNPFVVNK